MSDRATDRHARVVLRRATALGRFDPQRARRAGGHRRRAGGRPGSRWQGATRHDGAGEADRPRAGRAASSRTSWSATSTGTPTGGPSPRPTTPGSRCSPTTPTTSTTTRTTRRGRSSASHSWSSTLTLAIVTGLSVDDVSRNAVANLGWDHVRCSGAGVRGRHAVRRVRGARGAPVAVTAGPGHRPGAHPRVQSTRRDGDHLRAHGARLYAGRAPGRVVGRGMSEDAIVAVSAASPPRRGARVASA